MSKGIPKRLGEVYVFLLTRYAHFVTAICTLRVRDMHLWCVNRQWKELHTALEGAQLASLLREGDHLWWWKE